MVKNNKIMYFPKDYIEEDLKDFLLELDIVQEIKRPDAFSRIEEDEFLEFINKELKIPSKFSWIENNSFNDWTIELLGKIDELKSENEIKKLYKLIDILFFEKNYNNGNHNVYHNWFYDKEELKEKIPILCRDSEYSVCKDSKLIFMGEEKYKNETNFADIICHDKYENHNYCTLFGAIKFSEIKAPSMFEFYGENYSEKYPLKFWRWVYECQINNDINTGLVDMLLKGLNNNEFKNLYKPQEIEKAQRFLLDIIKEKEIENNSSVELLDSVIADYLEIVNKCSLEISCSNPRKIDIKEMVQEIQKEIQFHDKYDEINKWIENIIVVGEKRQEIGFAQLAESTLSLPRQTDKRRYRECISWFLKNQYNISIDKREYTITAIDNTCAIKVSEITDEEFNTLEIKNLDWVNINDKETKKRLLMEPYLYKSKYIQGYGRTCPLCGKVVITEITTMRIKTIVEENKRYDFLCCSSCADLFNYCDNQPKIDFEGLGKINAKIKLEFFMEPHFLSEPYKVEFKPRPLHRKVLLIEKGELETEGTNNV